MQTESIEQSRIGELSTLSLAHIGDGVFELLARTHVVAEGQCRVEQMHRRTVALVSAPAQARAAEILLSSLTQEEIAVYKRGRNAKPKSSPAHATTAQYARSTGLEALFGYLYLSGRAERIYELWEKILQSKQGDEA